MTDVNRKWKPGDVVQLKTGGWPVLLVALVTHGSYGKVPNGERLASMRS